MSSEVMDNQTRDVGERGLKQWLRQHGAPKDVDRTNKFLLWLTIVMIVAAAIVFGFAVYSSTPKSLTSGSTQYVG